MEPRRGGLRAILLTSVFLTTVPVPGRASPLSPRAEKPELYSEAFTTVFNGADDTFVKMELSVSNIGFGDGNAACRMVVVDSTGTWSAARPMGRKDWAFHEPDELEVGLCRMSRGPDGVKVFVSVKGGTVEAFLQGTMLEVTPPGHRIEVKRRFFEQSVLLRHGKADLRLSLPGRTVRELSGFAAIDHFRVTAPPGDLATRWVRVYGLDGQGSLLLVARFPPGREAPSGWIWTPDAAAPVALSGIEMANGPREAPDFRVRVGESVYSFSARNPLHRFAPVEELGVWSFLISPFLGNPVSYTYRAAVNSTGSGMPGAAIVEITYSDD